MTVKKVGEINSKKIYEGELKIDIHKAIKVRVRGRIRDYVRGARAYFYNNVIFFKHGKKWWFIGEYKDVKEIAK